MLGVKQYCPICEETTIMAPIGENHPMKDPETDEEILIPDIVCMKCKQGKWIPPCSPSTIKFIEMEDP